MLALALPSAAAGAARDPRVVARSVGSDLPRAQAIAARILARQEPAQVVRVRVDGAGAHRVAGITIAGTKFRGPISEGRFVAEVVAVVRDAFVDPAIEETDVWVTVPIVAGEGVVVSGDLAQPTTRNVFTVTVPRTRAAAVARLARSRDAYWDSAFRASLGTLRTGP